MSKYFKGNRSMKLDTDVYHKLIVIVKVLYNTNYNYMITSFFYKYLIHLISKNLGIGTNYGRKIFCFIVVVCPPKLAIRRELSSSINMKNLSILNFATAKCRGIYSTWNCEREGQIFPWILECGWQIWFNFALKHKFKKKRQN